MVQPSNALPTLRHGTPSFYSISLLLPHSSTVVQRKPKSDKENLTHTHCTLNPCIQAKDVKLWALEARRSLVLDLLDCWVEKCEGSATVEVIPKIAKFLCNLLHPSSFPIQGPPNCTFAPKLQRHEDKGGEDDQHVLSLLPANQSSMIFRPSTKSLPFTIPNAMSTFNKKYIAIFN